MSKQTHKSRILIYLRSRPYYINSAELENVATEWGAKPSTISRRCRELYEEGKLDRRIVNGVVWYKLKQMSADEANDFIKSLRVQGALL